MKKGMLLEKGTGWMDIMTPKNGGTKIYNADGTCTDSKFFKATPHRAGVAYILNSVNVNDGRMMQTNHESLQPLFLIRNFRN